MAVESVKRYLEAVVKMRGSLPYPCVEELMLEYGKEYPIGANTFKGKRGPEKMCYMNAFRLAIDKPELTYVEGYVDIGVMSIQHAWCVDKQGNVIDPTLKAYKPDEVVGPKAYFGIPFKTQYIRKVARDTGVYGILSHTNAPLLMGKVSVGEFLEDSNGNEQEGFHSTGKRNQVAQ